MSKIIGVHDHAVSKSKWLDKNSSYTWLRAFEEILLQEKIAILATNEPEEVLRDEVNNVKTYFKNKNFSEWAKLLIAESPDVILFNICYYSRWVDCVNDLKKRLPKSQLIARVHHDVRYLSQHEGFFEFIEQMDKVIVPNEQQKNYLNRFINIKYEVLPFAANLSISEREIDNWLDRLDLVSTANQHPARNLRLIQLLFWRLRLRGYKCQNLQNLSRRRFHEKLYTARYFLLPALTEASGSRVLIEALKANCRPIVFLECLSAVELLEELNVPYVGVSSGLNYNYKTKRVCNKFGATSRLMTQIEPVLNVKDSSDAKPNFPSFLSEEYEISRLRDTILSECKD